MVVGARVVVGLAVVVGGTVVAVGGNVVVVVTTVVEGCASNSESPDLLHPAINTTATSSPATVLMPHVTSLDQQDSQKGLASSLQRCRRGDLNAPSQRHHSLRNRVWLRSCQISEVTSPPVKSPLGAEPRRTTTAW